MSTNAIIEAIDAQISRLQQAKALLKGHSPQAGERRPRRRLTAEARARIAAAQKKRWAKVKGKKK